MAAADGEVAFEGHGTSRRRDRRARPLSPAQTMTGGFTSTMGRSRSGSTAGIDSPSIRSRTADGLVVEDRLQPPCEGGGTPRSTAGLGMAEHEGLHVPAMSCRPTE